MGAIMYILATVMTPVDDGLYGAKGTDLTCQIQGFFIQFSLTSVFFNSMLSVYFYLVICKNWSEDRFRRKRVYFYAGVTALGLGLAIYGLWFYDAQLAVCYVVQPPVSKTWLPISFLYTTPICLALAILTTSSYLISRKVFQQEKASKKWKVEKKSNSLARRVFWQSFWYVMSFVTTLPFLVVSYYTAHYVSNPYAVMLLGGIFAPVQGFLNALVYFNRARVFERLGKTCAKRRKKKKSERGTPVQPKKKSERGTPVQPLAPSSRFPSSTGVDSSHGDHNSSTVASSSASSSIDQYAAVKEFCDLTETDGAFMNRGGNAANDDDDVDDDDEGIMSDDDPNDESEEPIRDAEFVNKDQQEQLFC
jgi:hypothetical protein